MQFTYPIKDAQAIEAFSPQKRTSSMKFIYFFLFLCVFFVLLDPDPDPATKINTDLLDPDPKPTKYERKPQTERPSFLPLSWHTEARKKEREDKSIYKYAKSLLFLQMSEASMINMERKKKLYINRLQV